MLASGKLLILVPIEEKSTVFAPKSAIVGLDKGAYLHVCHEGNLTNNPKLRSYTAKIKKAAEQLKKDLPGPETGFYRKSEFHIVAEYDWKQSCINTLFCRKQKRLENWCQGSVDSILGPVYEKDSIPDWEQIQKDIETFLFISLKSKEPNKQLYLNHYGQKIEYDEVLGSVELL